MLLDFPLVASIFVLSKKEPALPSGVPGEPCTKVQGAHLGYTASMRTVKPRDLQNTFSGWKGQGLRPGKEQRTGAGMPAGADFQAGFSPRQASTLLEANSQQTHHDSRQELKCHIWALISL